MEGERGEEFLLLADFDVARRVEAAIADAVAAVMQQLDFGGAANGQAARRQAMGSRLAIERRPRLRGAARVGHLFSITDLLIIGRPAPAPPQRNRGGTEPRKRSELAQS